MKFVDDDDDDDDDDGSCMLQLHTEPRPCHGVYSADDERMNATHRTCSRNPSN